jgi:hypothetical protein
MELRERAAPLVRLFKHAGSSFSLPDVAFRVNRYDPPPGHKEKFAVLYTADNLAGAAMETRVLQANSEDEYVVSDRRARPYKVARLQYQRPALFIDMTPELRLKLGIGRFQPDYLLYQQAALALYERFGQTAHGYSWESFHRGQPGRNYGFWHHRKDDIELQPVCPESDCPELLADAEWLELLKDFPAITVTADDLA